MVIWARENAPDVNGSYETAKFVDYWRAKSGRDGTKQDWVATWRNWIRKASETATHRPPGSPRTADDKVNGFIERGRRLQALHDQQQAKEIQA
jgi:hypothetical protein